MKTSKITLGTIFKQQAREQRAIQKAIKRAQELKAFREAMEAQKAEEVRIQGVVERIAKSVMNPMRKVTVKVNGDITDFSATKLSQEYTTKLGITDSIWAPWSKNFKK